MIKKFWTRMVITVIVFLVFTTIMASTTLPIKFQPIEKYQLTEYQQQIEQFIGHIKGIHIPVSGNRFPIYINPSTNSWRYSGINSWTSGYYPILLWWTYNKTKNSTDFNKAKQMTNYYYSVDTANWDNVNQYQVSTPYIHGMKFVSPSSTEYNNWKNKAFQHVNRLVNIQYNPIIGAFPGESSTSRDVIVDSMVVANSLLIWAYKNSNSESDKANYLNKLKSHANVVIRDHFKSDNSGAVWQSVHYNTDGTVAYKHNHQTEGSNTNPSYTWARGQAWFMYGLAELYEFAVYLNDPILKEKYIQTYNKAANFWIRSLDTYSDNGVMKNTIGMTTGKYDTSGTATATSSLFKMYRLTGNYNYLNAARRSFVRMLSPQYFNNGRLLHGFYAPWTVQDTELIWGDYYLSENFDRNVQSTSIIVALPNGGERWAIGTTNIIRWTYAGNPGSYVKIELLKGSLNKVITPNTKNDGSYSWYIQSSQTIGSDYKIRIISNNNSIYKDTSNNNFTISNPYISTISPNGGESWGRSTIHTITWKSAGNIGSYVKIELFKSGVLNRVISSTTSNDGSYSWTVPSTQTLGSYYKIKITSTSNSAYYDWSDNNFRIY